MTLGPALWCILAAALFGVSPAACRLLLGQIDPIPLAALLYLGAGLATLPFSFHKTGKKIYCDLLFSMDDSIILDWFKKMEDRLRDIIYEKRELWFYDELTLEDIEYNWIQYRML